MQQAVIKAAQKQATMHRIPLANVLACIDVESNGVTSAKVDGRDEPLIRWEGHYFDRRVNPSLRARARSLRLSAAKAGVIPNPNSQQARWDKLLKPAMKLDEKAAVESASYGVGQVMGSHWQTLGFTAHQEFLSRVRDSAEGQIDVMFRYIKVFGLIDELQRGDFAGFARGYNGPQYKKYKYDTKMRDRAKFYAKSFVHPVSNDNVPVADPTAAAKAATYARLGTEGAKVREIQALLVRAGFAVKVDGDFGPATKTAVENFQRKHLLKVDGKVGPATWAQLDTYRTDPGEKPGSLTVVSAATDTPEGRTGTAGAGAGVSLVAAKEAVQEATYSLGGSVGSGGWLDTLYIVLTLVGTGLTIAGILYLLYGWYKSRQNYGIAESA